MSRLVFKHIRSTANVGDRSCCPLDYLPFHDAVAMDLDEPTPRCDAVIFGGGKVFGSLHSKLGPNDRSARYRIAWGVSTVQSSVLSLRYALSRRDMSLVGSRDFGDKRYEFAPCVSCMSGLFDAEYTIKHSVVMYLHKGKTNKMGIDIPLGVPMLDNNCGSMQQALEFIGSGDVVVSNSYHGVYWGLLLGRKVVCLPFSKKFNYYRLPPTYAGPANWRESLSQARRQEDMLGVCRAATARFESRVRDLLVS